MIEVLNTIANNFLNIISIFLLLILLGISFYVIMSFYRKLKMATDKKEYKDLYICLLLEIMFFLLIIFSIINTIYDIFNVTA